MHLSEIWIYPVKSLGGIRLTEAKTEERGLQYDRRWMIIDDNDVFITQRVFTKMALIDVELLPEGLKISYRPEPGNAVTVPYNPYRPTGCNRNRMGRCGGRSNGK
jgi:uncharacterized protein YcbX